jgi:NAD(P)-dependent dehydrogenase (short-subunit alcohol dehydrogenase family)
MTHDIASDGAPVAVITGASRGLGRVLAVALASRGWRVVIDARRSAELAEAAAQIPNSTPVAGDITDPLHREALVAAAEVFGRIDLLVNNASDLGPTPLPKLADYPLGGLRRVVETDVVAPLALTQLLLPALRSTAGTVLNISSDAAIEAYEGWGGYGAAKAALDHLTRVLATEEAAVRCYAVDPGDMRTEMHQNAFPGEDISDRPEPETVVPALLRLLDERPVSGRYRAADWSPAEAAS